MCSLNPKSLKLRGDAWRDVKNRCEEKRYKQMCFKSNEISFPEVSCEVRSDRRHLNVPDEGPSIFTS